MKFSNITFPWSKIGFVTAFESSEQSEEVSNHFGLGGGSGIFLLGGLNTQHALTQSPFVPCPYTRSFGLNGNMIQTTGGRLSGMSISDVLLWYSSVLALVDSSSSQNSFSFSYLPFSLEGMNQVGFSFGSGFCA